MELRLATVPLTDPTWIEYARTFFTALVQQRALAGQTDDRDLLRMIESASVRELALLLGNTPAAPLLSSNEKMLSAVRTISASALRPLKYTSQLKGPDFSIRRWVSEGRSRLEGGQGGVLFIPYMAGEIAALRSIISAWMRIAIFEAMSMVEGDHRLPLPGGGSRNQDIAFRVPAGFRLQDATLRIHYYNYEHEVPLSTAK